MRTARAITIILVGCLLTVPEAVSAGEVRVSTAGQRTGMDVQSWRALKWSGVVRQKHDFSCGAASVATLLTHHYDRPTTEAEVFKQMFRAGDQDKIVRQGFSLLDMRNYLRARGYAADGFRVSLDRLAEEGIPAIVLINLDGYLHFVVIKGISGDEVLVGDPARGLKRYGREAFEAMMATEVIFVVRNHAEVARASFNRPEDWRRRPSAPLGTAVDRRSLMRVTVSLPGPNSF
jgi:hypothetical protein